MHVLHVGNMANDGYALVEALRGVGVDAELLINERDFGMGLPQWETMRVEGDPYRMDAGKLPPAPKWVKSWRSTGKYLRDVVNLSRAAEGYDFLHLHFPAMVYLPFTDKPYVVNEAGFIRQGYGELRGIPRVKLGLEAYRRARCVVYTNTDTREMVAGISPKRMEFIPFAINTERYAPGGDRCNDVLNLLHPTRMVFDVKGNDRMLRAFVRYIEGGGKAKLTLVDWGYSEDAEEAHRIVEPVKENIHWVPPMSKPLLIEAYQKCDAVLDQFTLGASGTTGFEAMACGAPLMMYFSPSAAEHFGEAPPCVNASSEDEILAGFSALESDTLRRHLSAEGRDFVERHLSYPVVGGQLKRLYGEVFN